MAIERDTDDAVETEGERRCRECLEFYKPLRRDDGFCSDYCMHKYDREMCAKDEDASDE